MVPPLTQALPFTGHASREAPPLAQDHAGPEQLVILVRPELCTLPHGASMPVTETPQVPRLPMPTSVSFLTLGIGGRGQSRDPSDVS